MHAYMYNHEKRFIYPFANPISIQWILYKRVNHTAHPSTQSSTSPPKTYNQTPSSPASDSQHYEPRTSTAQTPLYSIIVARSSPWGRPSSSENLRHMPSTGRGWRRGRERSAFGFVFPVWRWLGRLLSRCGGRSRLSGRVLRRRGGSRFGLRRVVLGWKLLMMMWWQRDRRRLLCRRMSRLV